MCDYVSVFRSGAIWSDARIQLLSTASLTNVCVCGGEGDVCVLGSLCVWWVEVCEGDEDVCVRERGRERERERQRDREREAERERERERQRERGREREREREREIGRASCRERV